LDKNWTRRLVYLGLLTALAVIFTRLIVVTVAIGGVDNFRLGIGQLFLILSGILYGPLAGAYVGAMADIIGFVVRPGGPYVPLFTLTSMLTATLPGLILVLLRRGRAGLPSLGQLLISVAIGQIISPILLTSYFLMISFGHPLLVSLTPRLITQAFLIPTFALMAHLLLRRLSGIVPLWEGMAAAKAVGRVKN
jgi:ECF transporter S component (folate family)